MGGSLAELDVTLKQLEKEIAANEAGRKEATAIREKEKTDYIEKRSESEQCIMALHQAIGVLEGAGTKKKDLFLGTMQQAEVLSAAAGIRNVVLHRHAIKDMVSDDDLKLVREFVEKPEAYEPKKSLMSGAEIGSQVNQNPFGDYAPASTQIIGILKSMYDSFTNDLEKDNAEEADKQKAYQ